MLIGAIEVLAKSGRALNDFQGLFLEKKILDMFWGTFGDVETYSENKKIFWSGLVKKGDSHDVL